jgi:hypothetical protein
MELMMTSADTAVFGQIALIVVVSLGAMTGMGVMLHAYLQRSKARASKQVTVGDDDRMRRLEQAVDSIAIEVERISEGQRFLTKLHSNKPVEHFIGE